MQETVQQHATQVAGLEKERDFYYQKLRDVELICQEPECENQTYIQKILEILYATEVRILNKLFKKISFACNHTAIVHPFADYEFAIF